MLLSQAGRNVDVASSLLKSMSIPYIVASPLLLQSIPQWKQNGVLGLQSVVFVIGPNSNKISFEQKSGLLNAVKTGNERDLVKHYGELEYSSIQEERQRGYNRRRLRLLKKLEGIITEKFDSPPSIYSSHENYEKEQWRLVHRRVFKNYGYTGEQFRMESNKFWVSNYGRLIYFDNLDTNDPTPNLCTERPHIDSNYVSSGFHNSKVNVTDDPDDNNDDNADPDYIKLLRVPRSYVVFFTFYKWDDEKLGKFDKDTMIIDHINGDKSDNHFINLYPLPKESNAKVRDKLNRNNVYGTNAVCKGGEEDDDNGISRDILWINKVTKAGSATPATGYIVYKKDKVRAIRKRAVMEVEAGHFDKLCCNHILYMFFKRRDLYVLKEKFFDKTYLIGGEAATTMNNDEDNSEEEEDEQQQQQQLRRRGGGTALREDTTATADSTARNNLTPRHPPVTPGSATAQQQRGRDGGSTLTRARVTIGRRTVYPDRSNNGAPTPQLLFTRNEEPPPPGEEGEEEDNGLTIGDLLTLSKDEYTIDNGDKDSSWRSRNSIFHVLYHQLKKIGKLDDSFNGIILKKTIAYFVRDFENQPLTYEKNKIYEFIAKQNDTSDAIYNKVKYVSDLLQGRDGGNVSGSAGGVIEGFITSILYNVTVVYWYHDGVSGKITQYNKWDAAFGGSEIIHIFSKDTCIGNTSYCPMYIHSNNTSISTDNVFSKYVVGNCLDVGRYMKSDQHVSRINEKLFKSIRQGDFIKVIDKEEGEEDNGYICVYKVNSVSGDTEDTTQYTLSNGNVVGVNDIEGLASCHICSAVEGEAIEGGETNFFLVIIICYTCILYNVPN